MELVNFQEGPDSMSPLDLCNELHAYPYGTNILIHDYFINLIITLKKVPAIWDRSLFKCQRGAAKKVGGHVNLHVARRGMGRHKL